jgi:biopolymer transport protein ExbD
MAWKVRHEGSPQAVEAPDAAAVLHGIEDGRWEPTDEVQGPNETTWTALENHPQFADAVADLEPPPSRSYDDETRLDMNALIDVTLVLLIIFILTATYSVLVKRLDLPPVSMQNVGPAVVTKEIRDVSILVEVKKGADGKTIYLVENKEVPADSLAAELQRHKSTQGGLTTLLLQHDNEVTHGDVVRAQDAARGARLDRILLVLPETK